jgi:glycerol-3-phosphate acyltransferase PlsY
MGWKFGVIVALIDILKAFIPVLIAKELFSIQVTGLFIIGFSVIIGHIFPLPLHFKGGKGIASFIGMCYALDLRLGLLMNLILIVITVLTDYIFIGSLTLYALLPIIFIVTHQSTTTISLSLILMFIGIYKHWSNIISLKSGKEVGLKAVYNKHRK